MSTASTPAINGMMFGSDVKPRFVPIDIAVPTTARPIVRRAADRETGLGRA
jgi:hypothetical protein